MNCPKCFYLEQRLGIPRPSSVPLSLNNAVDQLLKTEFDSYRTKGEAHPFLKAYGIKDIVPYQHELMDIWREAKTAGIEFIHPPTNFRVTGGVDDVWINGKGELVIADYKATSKPNTEDINIDAPWQIAYKRQMEVYQWLFKMNGFPVSNIGYFVYVNGKADKEAFDGKLEFEPKLIPYEGNDAWIEPALMMAKDCLDALDLPQSDPECECCGYYSNRMQAENGK